MTVTIFICQVGVGLSTRVQVPGFWQSTTNGMPITNDAFQKTTTGSDFYFIVLNGDATKLVYSTYLGGSISKTHVDGGTSRFDKYGIVYHAVCSGCQFGTGTFQSYSDFPTTPKAKSRVNGSLNCNNAAFKFDLSSLSAWFDTNNLALTMPGFNNVCYPDTIVFQNLSTGGRTIEWNFDDGTIVRRKDTDSRNIRHQFKEEGQYHVKLKIIDLATCTQVDSVTRVINYFKENIIVGEDAMVCGDGSTNFQLTASGGVTYSWTSADGTFSSSEQSPTIQPKNSNAYYVYVVDANGCSKKDTLNLIVTPNVSALFQTNNASFTKPGYNNVCFPDSIRFKNISANGESFIWDFGDGSSLANLKEDTTSFFHKFQQEGAYKVRLIASNFFSCNKSDTAIQTINYFKDHIVVGDDGEICEGTTFQLIANGGNIYNWSTADHSFSSSNSSPVVQPANTTHYFVTVTDANNCQRKDTIKVSVVNRVDLKWQHLLKGNCIDRPSIFVRNLNPSQEDATFQFDFGDGSTSKEIEVEHDYENDGLYTLRFSAQKKICTFDETVQLPVYNMLVPNVFTPDTPPENDYFEIRLGKAKIAPADVGLTVQLIVVDRWGKRIFESANYNNDWSAQGVPGGVYYVQVKIGDFATCKNWVQVIK